MPVSLKVSDMALPPIVIATPHQRHDQLEQLVRDGFPDRAVIRIRLREDLTFQKLDEIKPAFVFFPHWSWLIPEDVHSNFDCVIFHMTDLPFGRGGSPLQNLVVRGYQDTMLSALKCAKELDAGPVYLKQPLSLAGTAEEILQRASLMTEKMIFDIVTRQAVPLPQKGDIVEFKRRRPEDGDIAQLGELEQIYDYIRMLDADGYSSAFVKTEHFRFEFSDAQLGEEFIEAKVRIKRSSND